MPKLLSQSKHEEFEPNSALHIRDQNERRAENAKKLELQEIWQGSKFSQPALFIMLKFHPAHYSCLMHTVHFSQTVPVARLKFFFLFLLLVSSHFIPSNIFWF